jgi:Mn-dependent DtxR family transcriptional regulator
MKLVQPTDFDILETLSDGRRNNAINIAKLLDQERGYVNTRLPHLAEHALVETVGPANNSGLYQITKKGKKAIQYRHKYKENQDTFESMLTE